MVHRSVALGVFALTVLLGCEAGAANGSSPRVAEDGPEDATDGGASREPPGLCVAIRGNGPRLTSHFGALARIVEHYGLVDATAGGSSAAITTFVLESIQQNPLVDCADCPPETRRVRAAILLKSIQGYLDVVEGESEAQVLRFIRRLDAEMEREGVDVLLESFRLNGLSRMRDVLASPDTRELVNEELFALMETSPTKVAHARDVLEGIRTTLDYRADVTSLVRPGALSLPALAERLSRLADFYAGYEPTDLERLRAFLDGCGAHSRGRTWADISRVEVDGAFCGDLFQELVIDYRAARPEVAADARRLHEPVGGDLRTLVVAAVLVGEGQEAFERARADYLDGAFPSALGVDFEDVRFGYWGHPHDLARLDENPRGYEDPKTRRTITLGQASWRDALVRSAGEPGLARGVELDGVGVTIGGWGDFQPVTVLRNIGCERVVYLTRRGEESTFVTDVARVVGAPEAELEALYALETDSSARLAIEEADGIWCTDWDAPEATDLDAMQRDGYEAPFVTRHPSFTGEGAYPNTIRASNLAGCSPGAEVE